MSIGPIMLAGAVGIGLFALLAALPWPHCEATSPHGARIGGVILIEGCR